MITTYIPTEKMGAALKKDKKVKVFIPKNPNAEDYKSQLVQVNGYNVLVEVGREVEVPETIAEVLKQKGLI